jgi:hypothetical protein
MRDAAEIDVSQWAPLALSLMVEFDDAFVFQPSGPAVIALDRYKEAVACAA